MLLRPIERDYLIQSYVVLDGPPEVAEHELFKTPLKEWTLEQWKEVLSKFSPNLIISQIMVALHWAAQQESSMEAKGYIESLRNKAIIEVGGDELITDNYLFLLMAGLTFLQPDELMELIQEFSISQEYIEARHLLALLSNLTQGGVEPIQISSVFLN